MPSKVKRREEQKSLGERSPADRNQDDLSQDKQTVSDVIAQTNAFQANPTDAKSEKLCQHRASQDKHCDETLVNTTKVKTAHSTHKSQESKILVQF